MYFKMRKDIIKEIEVPKEMEAEVKGREIKIKKGDKEICKNIPMSIKKNENKIIINVKKATKNEKKLIGTTASIIKNMISGLNEDFVYKLKICSVHFPMNVTIENGKVMIKNFLGETKPRVVKVLEEADVKIEGDVIEVKSSDKEIAGQMAADIEAATKVKKRDRRIFQDGIYMTEKAGREIWSF